MHPKFEVDKVYVAKVKGRLSNRAQEQLRHGVMIDGHKTKKAKVKVLNYDADKKRTTVSLTIHEGHYHQVKRMLKAVGNPVVKLHREQYGPIDLTGLPSAGQFRELKPHEVAELKQLGKA